MNVLKKAYDFTSQALMHDNRIEEITLSKYINNKYGLLIFYPLNFTFVCPTELLEFNKILDKLQSLNCEPLFISVDSIHSHLAWKSQNIEDGGVKGIRIPMVSDLTKKIIKEYNVEHNDGIAFRGTFLIDRSFIIRSININDLPLGRNINECLRLVEALQHHEKHGNVCPANWKKGSLDMHPSQTGIKNYLKNQNQR